ncbi:dihydrolipoamide dehydrogenase [Lipingzhangella halophila]|uniref:Dihydrolipoyl dehydrogenase n=1 Tax=Lipingzhangella halophila TaxID=1783352 RepID=A0A7W7RDG9_9ACTN|nr:dihydrolipoyl dehydrogenase [Lipingzhangella halophila]MBB4929977.1 dihydrolipoamide dehydrogenase [Lipingzhangella halophila]
MSAHFDVVVLGAGPGGYVAAIRAAQLGKSVAVVEAKYWGGVCLNVGCIPSKALLHNAELARLVTHDAARFGISFDGDVHLDYGTAYTRSREAADGRVNGVHFLMKKNNITEYDGWGTFTSATSLDVALNSGGTETLTFDHCIVATGATTKLLPGTQLSERVVSYEEQIMRSELPDSVIIAGAGAIGVEFGYIMANYGVDVTIVEFLDRMVPLEDAEVAKELNRQFKKLGIKVRTSTRVDAIDDSGDKVTVTVTKGDQSEVLQADKVLQAIGFAPCVEGYGLDRAGVRLTGHGAIDIDDYMRTSAPNIHAIGDATGKLLLAHTAEAQGIVAAETIAGAETFPIDYVMVPRATYCQPQIASFGYTEEQARELNYDVKIAKFPFMANGKAHGLGETAGFVKIIADARYNELLGAHMIGPDVTELLPELTLAQKWDLTADEVARNIHAHPTLSEAIQEAIHGIAGHMINL